MDTDELYYYRARYYDPTLERFISEDPIEFESNDFNFYRYVGNDPVNLVDPEGLFAPAVYYAFYYAAMFASGYWAIHESLPHAQNLVNDPVWNVPTYDDGSVVCEAKKSKSNKKERATDIPSWAKGEQPLPGESGNDFAERLLNEKYGKGNWKRGPKTEHNKLRKNGDRNRK